MKQMWRHLGTAALVAGVLLLPASSGEAQEEETLSRPPIADVSTGAISIAWHPRVENEGMILTVSGPDGLIWRREFAAGITPSFEVIGDGGKPLPDGAYTYELVATPVLDGATRQALAAARRAGDDSTIARLRAAGKLPRIALIQSGTFTVSGGAVVPQDLEEEPTDGTPRSTKARSRLRSITAEDQVIPDDLIVQGRLCAGLDCLNNESFGFDIIRLKDHNLRIKFEDVSTTSGQPSNDWQLTANDTPFLAAPTAFRSRTSPAQESRSPSPPGPRATRSSSTAPAGSASGPPLRRSTSTSTRAASRLCDWSRTAPEVSPPRPGT